MSSKINISKWLFRFFGGFGLWVIAIFFGLITLKGSVKGFFTPEWFQQTGSVYLLWGFLNFLIFFGLVHFIIPNGFNERKYPRMVIYTYILIIAVGFLKYYFVCLPRFEYVRVNYYKDEAGNIPVYFTLREYLQKTLFTGTFVATLAYAWGLTFNWIKGEKQKKELMSRQKDAELSFLKMQLNPHFLFNSLNSIYALSLKKSDAAPQAVLKLSEMMRYMLYEKEDADHKVPLDKEIIYLQNYIGLQKIRYKDHVCIEMMIEGDTGGMRISPMILIPFVENGFKHGVLNDESYPLTVQLVAEGDRLIFNVKNKKNLDNKDFAGGIGMDNVKRRLALLYPAKHQLTISDKEELYKAELVLFL